MKVIIAGGRDFADYAFLKEKADSILKNVKKMLEFSIEFYSTNIRKKLLV